MTVHSGGVLCVRRRFPVQSAGRGVTDQPEESDVSSHLTPSRPGGGDHPSQSAWDYNARVGLILFAVYLALYGGFIGLSAFAREWMARPSVGGVNLAIVYGFGLIGGAFVLAVLYMFLCKPEPDARPELSEAEVAAKAVEEEGQA